MNNRLFESIMDIENEIFKEEGNSKIFSLPQILNLLNIEKLNVMILL